MTQEHPITPPPELFKQWEGVPRSLAFEAAYRAGADMELEACCEWLETGLYDFSIEAIAPSMTKRLRAARRPKPSSLKEQALALIDECTDPHGDYLDDNALTIIRRALEALPDD